MKIDASKSVQENLLNLVLNSNPSVTGLTLAKITIGAVSALTGDASGKNSQVTLTAVKNAGYSGSQTIKFNRLSVSQGVASVPASISINPTDTQAQRIAKVISALGLVTGQVTVTNTSGGDIGTPANEDDTSVSVTVTPNANSSLYVGNALVIQLTTPDTDVDLASVITNTNMNGFDPA